MIKKLYIEPTSLCNLNCTMCFRNTWINEKKGHMDMECFYKVIEDNRALERTEIVFFGGMGEPLCHPQIIPMISAAKKTGKRIELLTNGTLLSEEMSAALLFAGLDKLWVSIDGFDKAVYESIRTGSEYDLICRNLRFFNKMRNSNVDMEERIRNLAPGYLECISDGKTAELGITFVVMKNNISQLEKMMEFAHEYRIDEVHLSNVIPGSQEMAKQMLYTKLMKRPGKRNISEQWGLQIEQSLISLPLMDLQEEGVVEIIRDLMKWGGNFQFGGYPLDQKLLECPFIKMETTFIRWDGDVSPCMGLLHSADVYTFNKKRTVWHYSFGNIEDKSLWQIWNKKAYVCFRERVNKFQFSPCLECDGCNLRDENQKDCFDNEDPTCGGCVWAGGLVSCP